MALVLHSVTKKHNKSPGEPQSFPDRSTYYPKWTEADRRLDFSQGVEQILRRVRAFGPLECLANINDTVLYVQRAAG